jgi:hypothetical protein
MDCRLLFRTCRSPRVRCVSGFSVGIGTNFLPGCSASAVMMSRAHYVEVLGAGGGGDLGRLGGKGASVCWLVSLGHRVPAGCVITRGAFQRALEDIGLAPALDTLDSLLAGSGDMTATAETDSSEHPFSPNSIANPGADHANGRCLAALGAALRRCDRSFICYD